MYYIISSLSPNLVYIRWYRSQRPDTCPESGFVDDLRNRLDAAPDEGLYFLSDLRFGRIIDVRIIQRLAGLTKHPNWRGSAAFANDPVADMFVQIFSQFSHQPEAHREIWDRPEDAISYLESLKPGLTKAIHWNEVFKSGDEQLSQKPNK